LVFFLYSFLSCHSFYNWLFFFPQVFAIGFHIVCFCPIPLNTISGTIGWFVPFHWMQFLEQLVFLSHSTKCNFGCHWFFSRHCKECPWLYNCFFVVQQLIWEMAKPVNDTLNRCAVTPCPPRGKRQKTPCPQGRVKKSLSFLILLKKNGD